jgi:hypothetical protein
MIYIIIEFFAFLIIGGISFGYLRPIAIEHIDKQFLAYPAAFDVAHITLLKGMVDFFLLFALIGSLIGVWVAIQRTKPTEVYYGR